MAQGSDCLPGESCGLGPALGAVKGDFSINISIRDNNS